MAEKLEQAIKMVGEAKAEQLKNIAQAFAGFRVIENPLIGANEIAIVCGSNIYKLLIDQKKVSDER